MSWLDRYFSSKNYGTVKLNGAYLPPELAINFVGTAVTATDDPANGQTTINISPAITAPAGTGVVTAAGGVFSTSPTLSVLEPGEVDITTQTTSTILRGLSYLASANGSNIMLQKARGSLAAPSKSLSGDQFGGIYGRGYEQNTPGFTGTLSGIRFVALEDTTNIAQGACVAFTATPVGSIVMKEVARFMPDGTTRLYNPAGTNYYSVSCGAIAGNRILAIPLLTADDVFVTQAFAQALTNKTLNLSSNTLTDTSGAVGDIAVHNGTKYVRLGRGTANQVLAVNSGGTNVAWASAPGGLGTNVTSGTGYIAIGATPATAGSIRLTNNQFVFQKDAGGTDRQLIGIDVSSYITIGSGQIQISAASDDIIIGTVNGQVLRGGANAGNPLLLLDGGTGRNGHVFNPTLSLTSTYSNSTVTATPTNLALNVQPSETWDITFEGLITTTTNGIKFQLNTPAGCTVTGYAFQVSSASIVATPFTSVNALSVAFGATAGTYNFRISITLTVGVNGGSVALAAAGASATLNQILAGCKMNFKRSIPV